MPEIPQTPEGRPEMKVAKMPGRDDMIGKLKDAGIYGMTPQSDRMFDNFVGSVADSEKVGPGLAMAWELASYDTLRDYPPQVQAIMSMYFDRVVDTVTPDPEVAEEAKKFMQEVREEARKGKNQA